MGLRDKLRRLQRVADENLITFELEDGTVARFPEEAYAECFLHEYERGSKHINGEDPGPAHPMIEALRKAKDLGAVVAEHGTLLGSLVGEDQIMRGEMERPGPPVNEVRPGVYE
jgi:hypothetical protein